MELDPDRRQPQAGTNPISLSPIAGDTRSVLAELFDGYENLLALVPPHIPDEEMECGGRQSLHEKLINRARRKESITQFCGKCPVKDSCVIGLARR